MTGHEHVHDYCLVTLALSVLSASGYSSGLQNTGFHPEPVGLPGLDHVGHRLTGRHLRTTHGMNPIMSHGQTNQGHRAVERQYEKFQQKKRKESDLDSQHN